MCLRIMYYVLVEGKIGYVNVMMGWNEVYGKNGGS